MAILPTLLYRVKVVKYKTQKKNISNRQFNLKLKLHSKNQQIPHSIKMFIVTVVSPHRETRFHYAAERARDVLYKC